MRNIPHFNVLLMGVVRCIEGRNCRCLIVYRKWLISTVMRTLQRELVRENLPDYCDYGGVGGDRGDFLERPECPKDQYCTTKMVRTLRWLT